MGMTSIEVRSLLHSIKDQDAELEKKLVKIAELRTAVENCTAKLESDGSQHLNAGDKLSNLICKIIDLEKECERIRISVDYKRKTITELAEEITQEQHREYLMLRFIDGNGFYDTVMKMDLTDSTARRIDRKAIMDLTKLINDSKHNF